tara:strand:- start:17 stop:916 length:900 start_codon:yes stop_codon:yes gene_type:complete
MEIYADIGNLFKQNDISGVIDKSIKLFRKDGKPMNWNRRLPSSFNGTKITTEYILIDTKRSQTNYINIKNGNEFHFCLDNIPNEVNTYLQEQITKTIPNKSPIRIAEFISTGSTITLDCGDYHAMESYKKDSITRIILHRLIKQSIIPSGRSFKNIAESNALILLTELFPEDLFYIFYEPMTLNFSDDVVILKDYCIHCYNVDFSIRMKISSNLFGIEVKTDKESYEWKKNETHAKAKKYEKFLGSPCFLLIMNPKPTFYSIDETTITSFDSEKDFKDHISFFLNAEQYQSLKHKIVKT